MDALAAPLERFVASVSARWPAIALVALVFLIRWPAAPPAVRQFSERIDQLARKPRIATAVIFLLALLWIASSAAIHGLPLPWMHDDHANLLGGEMFARGGLSMPAHPFWQHFETMHVLQTPRYASKYPLGQSVVLGAGLAVFRHAIAGEWLVTSAAAAAIFWALLVWVPPPAALLGGVAAAIHPTMLEWGHAYRGGGLAALGGALLIGATGRLLDGFTARYTALFAAGAVVLALSRPYEGAVITVACALVLVALRVAQASSLLPRGDGESRPAMTRRALLAAGAVFLLGATAIATHNRAVTGNAIELPWVVYQRQYDPMPPFVWQHPTPVPPHRNGEMRLFHGVIYMNQYLRVRNDFAGEVEKKIHVIRYAITGRPATDWLARFWPILLLPLLAMGRLSRVWWLIPVALTCAAAPLVISGWVMTHYLAPFAALGTVIVVMLLIGLSRMFACRRGAAAVTIISLWFVCNAVAEWHRWARTPEPGMERERRRLESLLPREGRHLVIVPDTIHDVVRNGPQIDEQHVVWARDLGDNERLLRYYGDRAAWWLQRDGRRFRLVLY